MNQKQKGFSLIEMTVSLFIISVATTASYLYYQKNEKVHRRENEIQKMLNFSKATANFIAANQAIAYNTVGKINISPEKLIQYGFLSSKEINQITDPDTNSVIYPCATVYVENGKLQGFIYFRTDATKMQITSFNSVNKNSNNANRIEQLFHGLNNLGSNAGVLTVDNNQYLLKGKSANWKMTNDQINQYLVKDGVPFLSDNINSCKGSGIAVPTYTMSLQDSLSSISSQLNDDNTVRQNSNEIVNSNKLNQTNVLNMDSTGISASPFDSVTKNKLVFQTNPNCVMNPSILSTMQDYADFDNGCSTWSNNIACTGIKVANKYGCRNKQLTLGVQSAKVNGTSLKAVIINGFTEVDTSYATQNLHNYLGVLNADTIQATAKVGYSDSCNISELGAMAQQKDYNGTDNLSKLYALNQSLLVCQKSLLCEQATGFDGTPADIAQCWLPVSNVTVEVNLDVNDKVLAYQAPKGFYVVPNTTVYTQKPDQQLNNMTNGGQRYGYFNYDNGAAGKNSTCHDENCLIPGLFGGCTWMVEAWGRFVGLPGIASDNIYASSSLLNVPASDLNGWTVWTDTQAVTFDGGGAGGYYGGKYVTAAPSTANNFASVLQTFEQKQNWGGSQQDVTYKFKSSFPYIANSKWDFRLTQYDSTPSPQQLQKCSSWHNNRIVTFPYYITKVTISNDTDKLIVDSTNPPVVPPIPVPSGTCAQGNIPSEILSNANNRANNYYYDADTSEEVVLAASSNINTTTTNISPGICSIKTTANYCPQLTNACKTWEIRYKRWQSIPGMFGCWWVNKGDSTSCVAGSSYSFSVNDGCNKPVFSGNCDGGSSGNPDNAIVAWTCVEQAVPNQCSNPRTKVVYEDTYQLP